MNDRNDTKPKLDPAATIVRTLGGPTATARIAGVDTVQVYRWMWSREDGGYDGVIPTRRASRLYEWARSNGKELPAELFFRPAA